MLIRARVPTLLYTQCSPVLISVVDGLQMFHLRLVLIVGTSILSEPLWRLIAPYPSQVSQHPIDIFRFFSLWSEDRSCHQ